ncbi:thioester reductase-like protein/pimeloyl-ACP methyl ester carboxylesterase [Paenibacillus sp. DS2015]|uniref:alpha/beta fold hydrolase n=1 Tax=Paenibacillus sp. DS2015 TaxID=3373917 RepID=UPI003D1E89F8
MAHLFLTGGTGFIGQSLIKDIARRGDQMTVLVRSIDRFDQLMRQSGLKQHLESIIPVSGDLTKPHLGLSELDWERVITANIIIHAGGPMDIQLDNQQAHQVFLEAAEHMTELAGLIHSTQTLRHFIHIVGFKSPIRDEDLANPEMILEALKQEAPYEKAKFLADLHIRQESMNKGFPLSVVHPGVVIGDSATGVTEQLGGLGILVNAARRKMMSIVPGGKEYWLPLFHLDHVSSFIAALTLEDNPANKTYYLLNSREDSPNMMQLLTTINRELRVPKPLGTLSPSLLSKVLGNRLGRKLRIPKESLSFVVNESFSLESARQIQLKYHLDYVVNSSTLPHVITDLDFRFSHSAAHHADYHLTRRGNLATLENRCEDGDPILFLPGTFSGADCLVPLAQNFQDSKVWLVDLPGIGRSPYHHTTNVIEGHVQALIDAIVTHNTSVTLIGHSYGALLAAKVMERIPERIHSIHLMQPIFHMAPAQFKYRCIIEMILPYITEATFKKSLLTQTCFDSVSQIPSDYIQYVLDDLKSPRVRKTLAETLSEVTNKDNFHLNPEVWDQKKVSILWGDHDLKYHIPKRYRHLQTQLLPYGHHFPISHPQETAQWLQQIVR